MNELEKLREEFAAKQAQRDADHQRLSERMSEALASFKETVARAREIERQAGIGEEK